MGRYYQTAAPEFVQDIMYKPPWELAKEVVAREQGDYDVAVGKANLLGNVDIKHMDTQIERDNAARISQAYAQKADDLVAQLQAGTADDWRSSLPTMTKLGRELAADYKTGDISKIEGSAAEYAKFLEGTKGIKDAGIRQAAKETYLNRFNQQAKGSLDKVFSADEVFDKKDYMKDFLEEQAKSNPDIVAKLKHYKAKGYLNTVEETNKFRKDYGQAFQNYISSRGLEPYFQQQQEFGLGQYTDEKGEMLPVTDPRSSLQADFNYAQGFNYNQQDKKETSKVDILAQEERARAFAREQAASTANMVIAAGPMRDAVVHSQEQIDKLNTNFQAAMDPLIQKFGVKSSREDGRVTPADIDKRIKFLRDHPGTSNLSKAILDKGIKELQQARNLYVANKTKAGYAPFAEAYGVENAVAAQAQFKDYTADPRKLYPIKGTLSINGKNLPDTSINDILAHPENKKYGLTPDQIKKFQGLKKDADGNLTDQQDYKDYFIQDSGLPVMVSGHPEDWQYNDYRTEYNIEGVPIMMQNSFEQLGVGMAQNASINQKKSSSRSASASTKTRR